MTSILPNWLGGDRAATIAAIIKNARDYGFCDSQIAYILATVEHETANTFQPVREGLKASDAWRKANFRYYPYYGRGYVQITWKSNYQKFGNLIRLDLVSQPDLALRPDISLFILLYGMKHGSFTGKSLNNYCRNLVTDFVEARRVINGVDRAFHIANIARHWEQRIISSNPK
ncbi:MAG: glycoside hydrolase family 19 protein [Xenococcaceae cyanobacterium]